jgi:calcineurin-like phosphoesterase family protein
MPNSFFTSDTHFWHTNIVEHSHRPFSSIEEMNEKLIENWNSVVTKKDNVYHLGDFSYGNKTKGLELTERLNGHIHLIRGNHDKVAWQIRHKFIWFKDVHEITVENQSIWLSHYAHRTWNKMHYGVWHCFGHSHGSLQDDPLFIEYGCRSRLS